MDKRFLLGLAGLLVFVGGGYTWIRYQVTQRKKFLKNLLSLPKESRFFWYLLRKHGYRVTGASVRGFFTVFSDGTPVRLGAKADFTAVKDLRKYACAVIGASDDERELARLYLTYKASFRVSGVIFYEPSERRMRVWGDR